MATSFPKVHKKRKPVVCMSHTEAIKLLRELKPQLQGCVVGEFPHTEKLAKFLNFNLKLVG